jgi:hypothetical protein
MFMTGSPQIDAERAFAHAARARRRHALVRRLRRYCRECGRLPVVDAATAGRSGAAPGPRLREIPIDSIRGTLEPSRANQFDGEFLPASLARGRWLRVWLAEQRGVTLPPISVMVIGDGYAIRDGHHRVSVAKARGALSIDAMVEVA